MRALPLSLAQARTADRLRDLGIMAVLLLWLLYTRMFWILKAAHLSAPICPFYLFTGHPCPFCGGTRSFAYMWEGDLSDAVRLYPLGPALFAGTILSVFGLAGGAATGRTWIPRLTSFQWRLLGIGVGSTITLSWALKVFILGN